MKTVYRIVGYFTIGFGVMLAIAIVLGIVLGISGVLASIFDKTTAGEILGYAFGTVIWAFIIGWCVANWRWLWENMG